MKKVFWILLFLFNLKYAFCQIEIDSLLKDSLNFRNYLIITHHTETMLKQIDPYTEGAYVIYISQILPHSRIVLLVGGNAKYNITECTTLSENITDRKRSITGYCMEREFYRQDNYFKYPISISYELVVKEEKRIYDYILDNLIIIDNR
jgi:hypothetical protein